MLTNDPYDDGSDPNPWCTSPEPADPNEVTDRAVADIKEEGK